MRNMCFMKKEESTEKRKYFISKFATTNPYNFTHVTLIAYNYGADYFLEKAGILSPTWLYSDTQGLPYSDIALTLNFAITGMCESKLSAHICFRHVNAKSRCV